MIEYPTINNCTREERQWLFMITWRIYSSRCQAKPEEQKAMISRIKWVRDEDMGKLLDLNSYMDAMPIDPPCTLTEEKAQIMWLEVMRICGLDGEISPSQRKLIVYLGKVLGFEREAMQPGMIMARRMALLEMEKAKLKQVLHHNYRRKTDAPANPLSPFEAGQSPSKESA